MSHTLRVRRHQSLISSDSGVMVDISRFGQTYDWVNEDIGSSLSSGSDGKFSMSSVHWVSSLESDDFSPCDLVEMGSEFGRGVSEGDVVVVFWCLNGLNRTTNVELLHLVVEVSGSWMGDVVGTEDLLCLEGLVGFVDIRDWG